MKDTPEQLRDSRILICGSRTFADHTAIEYVLCGAIEMYLAHNIVVIHGGAKGADDLAGSLALHYALDVEEYPADWSAHGRGAGPVRNKRMLVEGKPDVVWAFIDKPLAESKGTLNMVTLARKAGIPTYVVEA